MGKLFSALVLGGSMIAHADDNSTQVEETQVVEKYCQVAMVKTKFQMKGDPEITTICLDQQTDEEILNTINDAKEESCISPFCGCWLG